MGKIKHLNEWKDTLNEGAIKVFGPSSVYHPEGKGIEWKNFYKEAEVWLKEGLAVTIVSDFDLHQKGYNKKTTNPKFQSEPNGTWKDKSLPKFLDSNPKYDETEFDLIKVDETLSDRDGVYVQDKNGNEFCIHASKVMIVQKGASVRDDIQAGSIYLVEKMRAQIVNYKFTDPKKREGGVVSLRLQDGEVREITLPEWKKLNYLLLEKEKNTKTPLNEEEKLGRREQADKDYTDYKFNVGDKVVFFGAGEKILAQWIKDVYKREVKNTWEILESHHREEQNGLAATTYYSLRNTEDASIEFSMTEEFIKK